MMFNKTEKWLNNMKAHGAEYRAMGKGNFKHGFGSNKDGNRKREYNSWRSLKGRCYNPSNPKWISYGGRGITVCQRWQDDFMAFLEDVGKCPGPGYSLDRIDVNGNYEPGNCRWATAKEQANNRRPCEPPRLKWAWERYAERWG